MAVLARNRTLSKLEFYMNACRLRRQLIFLMGRGFGVKPRIRDTRFYTRKWDAEDAKQFCEILEKYGEKKVIDDYPLWMMEHIREEILKHLADMMKHITRAYTVWAINKAEANLRRCAQDLAIADCESLKQELELAADILPVGADKLRKLGEMVKAGEMDERDYINQYQSWRGDKRKYNAHDTLASMDLFFQKQRRHTNGRKDKGNPD